MVENAHTDTIKHFEPCMREVIEWIDANVLGDWVDDPLVGLPDTIDVRKRVSFHKLFFESD